MSSPPTDINDRNTGSSSVFDQTRLATALQIESEKVEYQLEKEREAVQLDKKNANVWTVYVEAQQHTTKKQSDNEKVCIDKVDFELHPTFVPRVVTCRQAPYEVQRIGWGVFRIWVRIWVKSQEEEAECLEFPHDLDFSQPKMCKTYNRKGLRIEVGNTHVSADNNNSTTTTTSDASKKVKKVVTRYNKERERRRMLLEASKQKYDQLQHAELQLEALLLQIPQERHDMALGAYLAGVYRGNLSNDYLLDLYEFATEHLRYIVLEDDRTASWRDYVIHWQDYLDPSHAKHDLLPAAFDLSQPLPKTERIDLFISHCWSDYKDGEAKADLLQDICRDFKAAMGRRPRLWLDMFCMPQAADNHSIAKNVAALPLFLKACNATAVLSSPRLVSRLWCLVEIYTAYILSSDDETDALQVYPMQITNASRPWRKNKKAHVWIDDAKCGLQSDQDFLFQNLRDAPGGLAGVEHAINTALSMPGVHRSIGT